MHVSQDTNFFNYSIQAYDKGSITLKIPENLKPEHPFLTVPKDAEKTDQTTNENIEILSNNFIMSSQKLVRNWAPNTVEDIRADHIREFLQFNPEVVLLGAGEKQKWPDMSVFSSLIKRNIGFEVMNTGSACRTFNILSAEGRRVVAAFIFG